MTKQGVEFDRIINAPVPGLIFRLLTVGWSGHKTAWPV